MFSHWSYVLEDLFGRVRAVTERVMASYRRLPSLAVNLDKSCRFAASTDDPDSFTNGASPLKWRPRVHHRQ